MPSAPAAFGAVTEPIRASPPPFGLGKPASGGQHRRACGPASERHATRPLGVHRVGRHCGAGAATTACRRSARRGEEPSELVRLRVMLNELTGVVGQLLRGANCPSCAMHGLGAQHGPGLT